MEIHCGFSVLGEFWFQIDPDAPEDHATVTSCNYWVACGNPVLKWGWFFSSREKLQFLRNIVCIGLNNDAAAV